MLGLLLWCQALKYRVKRSLSGNSNTLLLSYSDKRIEQPQPLPEPQSLPEIPTPLDGLFLGDQDKWVDDVLKVVSS